MLCETASGKVNYQPSEIASGIFFENDDISRLENQLEPLNSIEEFPPSPTKTASGRSDWLSPDPIGESGGLNLYAYVGNDPINGWDPLGLQVTATFHVGVGLLVVTDNDTGESVSISAFSGKGEDINKSSSEWKRAKGPLPRGKYDIMNRILGSSKNGLDRMQRDGRGVWALEAKDGRRDDKVYKPGTNFYRSLFRLHEGRGIGCVTSEDYGKWKSLKALLDKTKTVKIGKRTKYGELNVVTGAILPISARP